jgi:hypothetical protein
MSGERLYPGELANVDASNRRRELNGGSELLLEVVVQDDDAQWEGCKQMFTCGERMGWHGAGAVRFWFPNEIFSRSVTERIQILNFEFKFGYMVLIWI